MALFRIYPEKDANIWSEPTSAGLYGNAGKDEILEIGGYPDINLIGRTNRSLIQFKQSDIKTTIDSKVTGGFSASLHLSLASATEIPSTFNIYAYPISSSWKNGTGKRIDMEIMTPKYALKLNIRDTQGKDGYPTRMMADFTYR